MHNIMKTKCGRAMCAEQVIQLQSENAYLHNYLFLLPYDFNASDDITT